MDNSHLGQRKFRKHQCSEDFGWHFLEYPVLTFPQALSIIGGIWRPCPVETIVRRRCQEDAVCLFCHVSF